MIDYYSYKKIYSDGGLFTLSGKDFVGNVQYRDGIASDYDTGAILEPKNTFATDLFTSRFFKDRIVDDSFISLPISETECTFSLNETLNFKSFKYKLDQLKKNNTFVYSQLFIASNRLPVAESITYDAFDEDTNSLVNYNIGLGEAVFANPDFLTAQEDSDIYALGNVEDITAQPNYDFSDQFAMFCAAGNSFISLTGNSDGLSIVEKSEEYESTSNNIQKFGRVGGITSNSKYLFVSDSIENVVIKYDITGYVNNDTALANIRYLTSIMGGTGFTDRRSNFNEPTKLACTEDRLAVYDSSNECVKVYNTDFDYLTTLTFINLQKARGGIETFRAMAFDPDFKTLYVLTTTDTNNIILYRADINTRNIETINIADVLDEDEVVRSITFSQTDSNYWYYSTNKRIFKKYKTRPTVSSVGSYDEERLGDIRTSSIGSTSSENRWNKQKTVYNNTFFPWNFKPSSTVITTTDADVGLPIPGQKFRAFNIVPGLPGNEKILLFTKSRIYHFDEPVTLTYQKVLNKTNYDNYGLNGFSLSPEEYIQPAVLNSELYKLIYDLLAIKNNIVGRFAGKYNYKGELVLDNYNYNINYAALKRENIEDYFIHHNEESLVGALNRIFKQVYELQRFVVSAIQIDIGTQVREIETTSDDVEQKANLILRKEIKNPKSKYIVGDTIEYVVTLSNTGNIPAPNVRLQDSLQGIVVTEDKRGILSNNVDVNVGETLEVTYEYTLTQPGELTNSITAEGDNPANASSTINVDSNTDLTFTKTLVSEPGTLNVGNVLKYKLEVSNAGADAENVLVVDSKQANITNISGDLFNGIATLAESGVETTTYDYIIQEQDIGKKVVNKATLTANPAGGGEQIVLTDTTSTDGTTVVPAAFLTMTKNIVNEPSEIKVGDTLTYQVVVSNTGNAAASNLVLADSLNVVNVRGTGKSMLNGGLGTLATGSNVKVTYEYVVQSSDVGGKVINTATLTADTDGAGTLITITKTKETNTAVIVPSAKINYIQSSSQIGPSIYTDYDPFSSRTYTFRTQIGTSNKDRLIVVVGGAGHNDSDQTGARSCTITADQTYTLNRVTPISDTTFSSTFIFAGVIPANASGNAAGGPTGGDLKLKVGWRGVDSAMDDDYGATYKPTIDIYEVTDFDSANFLSRVDKNNGGGNFDLNIGEAITSNINIPAGGVCIGVCRSFNAYKGKFVLEPPFIANTTYNEPQLIGQVGAFTVNTDTTQTIKAKNTLSIYGIKDLSKCSFSAAVFR